ncbi:MAG: hypothetical protein Q9224_000451 [Gallowayella concinna]
MVWGNTSLVPLTSRNRLLVQQCSSYSILDSIHGQVDALGAWGSQSLHLPIRLSFQSSPQLLLPPSHHLVPFNLYDYLPSNPHCVSPLVDLNLILYSEMQPETNPMDTDASNTIDASTDNKGVNAGNIEAATDNMDASTGNIEAATDNRDASTGNIEAAPDNGDASTGNIEAATDNVNTSTDSIVATTGSVAVATQTIGARPAGVRSGVSRKYWVSEGLATVWIVLRRRIPTPLQPAREVRRQYQELAFLSKNSGTSINHGEWRAMATQIGISTTTEGRLFYLNSNGHWEAELGIYLMGPGQTAERMISLPRLRGEMPPRYGFQAIQAAIKREGKAVADTVGDRSVVFEVVPRGWSMNGVGVALPPPAVQDQSEARLKQEREDDEVGFWEKSSEP